MSTRKYQGSCHCGAVRFEADIDLEKGTGRCNCSICAKTRAWGAIVQPDAFRAIGGEKDLTEYRFGSEQVQHLFCSHCGVAPYARGHVEEVGGDFVYVNVACIDDLEPAELARVPVSYADGLHDNWRSAPAQTSYL